MLVGLLRYGYSRGVHSSCPLAQAGEERLDVMAVTGLNRPDFRTTSGFRHRHLAALADLFVQVLRLWGAIATTRASADASTAIGRDIRVSTPRSPG